MRLEVEKIVCNRRLLLRWAVQANSWSVLYTDFDDCWCCDGKLMLKVCPGMQGFLNVDSKSSKI